MIRVYKTGDLSSGFVGVRVAVSVNSKLKQKYYSFKEYTYTRAMELASIQEQTWLKQQARHFRDRVLSQSTNTGIAGLSFTFDVCRKKHGTYIYRRLSYQCRIKDEWTCRSWSVDKGLTDDIWFDVCNTIRNTRGTTNKVFDNIMGRKPSADKIDDLYLNTLGSPVI